MASTHVGNSLLAPFGFSGLIAILVLALCFPLCLLFLQFRQLGFHLCDKHLQLLLALLAGMGVDITRELLAVDPHGRVASLVEVVVDLTDASGGAVAK